ncbi:MAG TPA: nucleotidyltransferase [Thermoanaerobaculia bacterium]|nr:nucleotidyltransferase [Thermoanaerobaculia bacterium]
MAGATKDFKELLAALLRRDVRFVVVGAHALAFHAKPRYTKDLDVFVEPSRTNAAKVVEALEEFGFTGIGIGPADFETPGRIVQLGVPPNRIDLMTRIDGVSFEEAWASRVEGGYGGIRVPYIGYDDLVRNKSAARRPQDLADLEILKLAKR